MRPTREWNVKLSNDYIISSANKISTPPALTMREPTITEMLRSVFLNKGPFRHHKKFTSKTRMPTRYSMYVVSSIFLLVCLIWGRNKVENVKWVNRRCVEKYATNCFWWILPGTGIRFTLRSHPRARRKWFRELTSLNGSHYSHCSTVHKLHDYHNVLEPTNSAIASQKLLLSTNYATPLYFSLFSIAVS